MTEQDLVVSLVAWLRWHAATKDEIERAPDEVRPLLVAMSTAKHYGAIAMLADRVSRMP